MRKMLNDLINKMKYQMLAKIVIMANLRWVRILHKGNIYTHTLGLQNKEETSQSPRGNPLKCYSDNNCKVCEEMHRQSQSHGPKPGASITRIFRLCLR